jgi:signal peptidase I
MTRRAVVTLFAIACTHPAASYTAGDSMVPSVAVGARVAARAVGGVPARGRVIVFHGPETPDREYVKRVVGLPGDTIATTGNTIAVNGTPIPRCRVGAWTFDAHAGEIWLEAVDGASWLVFDEATPTKQYGSGPWHVAAGEVFVLGDNRGNSHDSRLWFGGRGGGLPLRLIIGAADAAAPKLPAGAELLAPALAACVAELR